MATDTMNIALPETMKAFVADEVKNGGYNSASEYIRDLIRLRKRKAETEKLEEMLLEAINDGNSTELTREDFEGMKNEVLARLKQDGHG